MCVNSLRSNKRRQINWAQKIVLQSEKNRDIWHHELRVCLKNDLAEWEHSACEEQWESKGRPSSEEPESIQSVHWIVNEEILKTSVYWGDYDVIRTVFQ